MSKYRKKYPNGSEKLMGRNWGVKNKIDKIKGTQEVIISQIEKRFNFKQIPLYRIKTQELKKYLGADFVGLKIKINSSHRLEFIKIIRDDKKGPLVVAIPGFESKPISGGETEYTAKPTTFFEDTAIELVHVNEEDSNIEIPIFEFILKTTEILNLRKKVVKIG